MSAYLIRHAKAGDRAGWERDDRLRPLSKAGMGQADGLVQILEDAAIEAVLSSPYLRCIQTVEPVARHFGLRVEPEDGLAEGAGAAGVGQIIRRFAARNVVLCTHGDVLEEFLQQLVEEGTVMRARVRLEKGSTWVVREEDGRIIEARYIAAP